MPFVVRWQEISRENREYESRRARFCAKAIKLDLIGGQVLRRSEMQRLPAVYAHRPASSGGAAAPSSFENAT